MKRRFEKIGRSINEMARKINALKEDFDKEFKARGINISEDVKN